MVANRDEVRSKGDGTAVLAATRLRHKLNVRVPFLCMWTLIALAVTYAVAPVGFDPELYVSVHDGPEGRPGGPQEGEYWFDRLPGRGKVSTHPKMRHSYAGPKLWTHPTVTVSDLSGIDEIFATLFPGARLLEPPLGPTSIASHDGREVDPTASAWTCFFEHADRRLDSVAILVFENVYDRERAALILRARRGGSRWISTIQLHSFNILSGARSTGIKRLARGYYLTVLVDQTRPLTNLPTSLQGRPWFQP